MFPCLCWFKIYKELKTFEYFIDILLKTEFPKCICLQIIILPSYFGFQKFQIPKIMHCIHKHHGIYALGKILNIKCKCANPRNLVFTYIEANLPNFKFSKLFLN